MAGSAIADKFGELKAKNEKALIIFVTAGDPHLSQLPAIVSAIQDGGADIIELGVPFSDPIADGPVIQAASQRALEAGATPRGVLESLGKCELKVPIVLMGYYNPILRYGLHAFATAAKRAGANGTIVCDLTPEEAGDWIAASREDGLENIFLGAPTSTDERIEQVARASTGFVYAVSRTGVTGTGSTLSHSAEGLVARIRQHTDTPVCVGFGVSTPEHVREVCSFADGAVVGSSVVKLIECCWNGDEGREELTSFIRSLKEATLS
jgi:tryptophan synthase alpha chain